MDGVRNDTLPNKKRCGKEGQRCFVVMVIPSSEETSLEELY